jgi:hypothetical protein
LKKTRKNTSSSRSRSASRSASERRQSVGSINQSRLDSNNQINDSSIFHTVNRKSNERNPMLAKVLTRPSRSLTPTHFHKLGPSLNKNLNTQNNRHSSRSRSPSTSNRTYDILPETGDMTKKYDTTLGE